MEGLLNLSMDYVVNFQERVCFILWILVLVFTTKNERSALFPAVA